MVRDGKKEKKIFLEKEEGDRREDFLEGDEGRATGARAHVCSVNARFGLLL
jgi:hypothetical protein